MKNKHIILLSAKAGHGKDTFALLLSQISDIQRVSFADALKLGAIKHHWSGKKDDTGRTFLQRFGAAAREKDPDIWVKKALRAIRKNAFYPIDETSRTKMIMAGQDPIEQREDAKVIAITNCRFPNEIETVKRWGESRGYNVHTVRIDRPLYDNGLSNRARLDPSETSLDEYDFDFRFTNVSGDLSCLKSQISLLASHWGLEPRSIQVCKACEAGKLVAELQGKKVLTLDFDDTLLEKTGTFNANELWRSLMRFGELTPVIVTSRKSDPIEDVTRFCDNLGVKPYGVIYDAGHKDILRTIKPIAHFDDDIEVNRMCAEAGIPVFMVGAFSSPDYVKNWCKSIEGLGELDFYTNALGLSKDELTGRKQIEKAGGEIEYVPDMVCGFK